MTTTAAPQPRPVAYDVADAGEVAAAWRAEGYGQCWGAEISIEPVELAQRKLDAVAALSHIDSADKTHAGRAPTQPAYFDRT